MDILDIKELINSDVIDFTELILKSYYKLGIDETDAVIIVKLQYLLKNNITFISPKNLSEMLSISPQTTSKRLNSLIEKGFIHMELIEKSNGKQTESFNLDFLIEKIIKNNFESSNGTKKIITKSLEKKLVTMFEEEFKKPLSVLDIQILTKWLNEDKYTYEEISDALFESLRMRKTTLKYVDGILLKKDEKVDRKKYKKVSTISDLKKIWEE